MTPILLDASAAVKLVVKEPGSELIRRRISEKAGNYITALCLAESLGVLKRKRLRKELSEQDYFAYCYMLLAHLRGHSLRLDDVDLSNFETFSRAEGLAKKYGLDLSDSVQLVSILHGRLAIFAGESKATLVTADAELAKAAAAEGCVVWNCETEPYPF